MQRIIEIDRTTIRGIFSDFDHTMTEQDGTLASTTIAAIEALSGRKIPVTLVSGCSAGTADCLIRLLPVHAVIFENGAGIFIRKSQHVDTVWLADGNKREENRRRLDEVYEEIKKAVPEARHARGHYFRAFDYAVNYQEEEPRLTSTQVSKVIAVLKKFPEVSFRQSSIHINYWIGRYDKRTACEWWLKQNPSLTVDNTIYCGDSPNDEPLFEIFKNSVGVQNVTPFLDAMYFKPTFIADAPYGAGFCEVVNHLLTP